MSHEIESMMFVGATPWHGLGEQVPTGISTADAIQRAGLAWDVVLRGLYTVDVEEVDHKAVTRVSDGKILGVVGPNWRPLQNQEAFSFFDPFLTSGDAMIETAGSLRGGRRVWVLAALNLAPQTIVPGDEVRSYVLLSNAHDGTQAIRVGFTPIRVVCANTLAMAHGNAASKLLRVRHTKNAADTLAAVRDTMNMAQQAFEATAEQYRSLAQKRVNDADLKRFVKAVFTPKAKDVPAVPSSEPRMSGRDIIESILGEQELVAELTSGDRIVPKVQELFENGRGNTMAGVRGTAWGAYNAVTEYIAHDRGTNDGTRLNEAWFGSGATLNQRALALALETL